MKIAVLVDLTPICQKAVEIGSGIARLSGAELVLVHIAESGTDNLAKVEDQLTALAAKTAVGIKVTQNVSEGMFFSSVPTVVSDLGVDLVVVPTHGKVGIMQNLFGANILKLVKSLPVAALVVQENTRWSPASFEKLLFPVGPHSNFSIKYTQTAAFAKVFGSTVVIYTVRNDVRGLSEEMRKNIADSKSHFTQVGVAFEEVSEEPTGFSVGYAKHILAYADKAEIGTICIMAKAVDENDYIGNNDKENILLNESSLAVLSANG